MVIQNLNRALQNLSATNVAKQGRDAVAEHLTGLRTPTAPSPRFAEFDPRMAEPGCVVLTYSAKAKRVGRSAANFPGNRVRSRGWQLPAAWATSGSTGIAGSPIVSGPALSERCAWHHHTSGHDYPSHDRRDDQQSTVLGRMPPTFGSAITTYRGK